MKAQNRRLLLTETTTKTAIRTLRSDKSLLSMGGETSARMHKHLLTLQSGTPIWTTRNFPNVFLHTSQTQR